MKNLKDLFFASGFGMGCAIAWAMGYEVFVVLFVCTILFDVATEIKK